MISLVISKRIMKQLVNDKFSFLILLFLPGCMLIGFWAAFSSTSALGTTSTFDLIIINRDDGVVEELKPNLLMMNFSTSTVNDGFASDLINIIGEITYPENNNTIFKIQQQTYENIDEARREVEEKKYDAIVVFPENFSNTTLTAMNLAFEKTSGYLIPNFPTTDNGIVEIIGDTEYLRFQIADLIINLVLDRYEQELSSLNFSGGNIDISFSSLRFEEEYSIFDEIIPGIMVMAIILQGGMLCAILAAETNTPNKTLERIRISPIKPRNYMLGVSFAQLLVIPFQLLLLFILTIILGFQPNGSFIEAFLILWAISPFALALTFIGASIFKSPDAAAQAIGFSSMPLGFASGAFMSTPNIILFAKSFPTPSGEMRDFLLWDLLPTTHAVNATKAVLLDNNSLFAVLPDVLISIILSMLLVTLGIFLYARKHFRGDI